MSQFLTVFNEGCDQIGPEFLNQVADVTNGEFGRIRIRLDEQAAVPDPGLVDFPLFLKLSADEVERLHLLGQAFVDVYTTVFLMGYALEILTGQEDVITEGAGVQLHDHNPLGTVQNVAFVQIIGSNLHSRRGQQGSDRGLEGGATSKDILVHCYDC